MDSTGRVPPYNAEAEMAVLGSILLNNDSFHVVDSILDRSDFYVEAHCVMYDAICDLDKDKIPIDHVTLGNRLKEKGLLEKIGGAMSLSNLTDAVVTAENIEHYAGIVREASGIRKVIQACQKTVSVGLASTNTDGMPDAIHGVVEASNFLSRSRMPETIFKSGQGVIDLYKKVAGGYRGIPLPWPTLDNMTVGMWPKTVTVFVARPGTGKTFVATISGRHAWKEGRRTLLVSPEMSKLEIAERFFAIESNVSYKDMVRGQISDFSYPDLESTVDRTREESNLWIMDSDDDITVGGIEAAIRACKPDFVAIDSLYGVRAPGERRDRLLVALNWVMDAAKRLNFAACVFAQQNRKAELSEKKGGGSRLGTIALVDELSQDPHAVFALEQTNDDRADKILKVRTLKVRRGYISKPVVKVHWDWDENNYDEIEEEDDEYRDDDGGIPF